MNTTSLNNLSRSRLASGTGFAARLCALGVFLMAAIALQAQPTTVPATPAPPQGQVISLYNSSGVYTNIGNVNFDEYWWGGQMTFGGLYTVSPLTNQVQCYLTLYFDGVGFESNVQDVSGCTNLHVDVFTPNGSSFAVRIVDNQGHQSDITYTTASGVITNNGWISLNLPLAQFVANQPLLNLHYIQQMGWIINNAGETSPADYYIDNVYFNAGTNLVYIPPPVIPTPTNAAPVPSRPAGSVLAMYNSSGVYANSPVDDWDAGWSGSAESSFTITNTSDAVMYLPGLSYVGAEFYQPDQVNVASYSTLHFDVWTLNANQIGVELVSLNPTEGPALYVPIGVTNQWVGIDIPLSSFTAANPAVDLTDLQQLLWLDNGGTGIQTGTYYIDNVYFWTTNQVLATIAPGAQVSWTAPSGNDTYQPQKSANSSAWANWGSAISGNSVTSKFDNVQSPYYRVLDTSAAVANAILDPSFEVSASTSTKVANWTCGANSTYQSVWATNKYGSLLPTDGTNLLYMEGSTPATGAVTPPNAYVQSDRATVTGGDTYIVKWNAANPVQVGGANPQYRVSFYNSTGADVADHWGSFASAGGTWTTVSNNFSAPATATQMDILFIQAVGAGNGWDWVTLLDNMSAVDAAASPVNTTNILSAMVQPAAGISWRSGAGLTYTVQSSPSLGSPVWSPLGANVTATGTNTTVSDSATSPGKFYQVLEVY